MLALYQSLTFTNRSITGSGWLLFGVRVGPDITVYIRECEKDELEHLGGNPVEVRLREARTVVVQKAVGSTGLAEKVLRRFGFEIEDLLAQ